MDCPYVKLIAPHPSSAERIKIFFLRKVCRRALIWLHHHDGEIFLRMARTCTLCKGVYVTQYGRTVHLLPDGKMGLDAKSYIVSWKPLKGTE